MSNPKQPAQVDKATDGQAVPTPVPAPPAQAECALPPSLTRAKRLLDVLTSLATIVIALATLGALVVANRSLKITSESLRQNNLATIYALAFEATKFEEAHPELLKFFDKRVRRPMMDQELWDEYNKLSEKDQARVYLHCIQLADFSQLAFMQRDVLPANDWDTWWSYIVDQYDESPIYRDVLSKRPTWYVFLEATKPENRAKYYRGDQKR